MMSNIALSLFTFSSRTTLLAELVNNDSDRMVRLLSSWASMLGAAEFLLNPTVGRLSDHLGRKPFMLTSPIACVVLKTWCALRPSIAALTVEKVVCDGLRTMSGSTMCKAALSDLCSGDELSLAYGTLYSWAGVAIVGAPFVSSLIPNPRVTFGISAVWAVAQFVVEWFYLEETLPAAKRTPRFEGFSNPFGVAKLFSLTPALRKYSLIALLQYMCEPKNLSDISAMFQMDRLKWSSAKRDIFVSIMGFSFLFGSSVTRRSIGALGPWRHTSVMHYLSILQYCLRAFPYEVTTWLGVGVMMVSETKMNGVAALATEEAVTNGGLGKGEYSGLSANLRALMVFLSPFFMGGLYRYGTRRNMPGLPFLGAAVSMALSEGILQSMRRGEGGKRK
jgi:MFS family permease